MKKIIPIALLLLLPCLMHAKDDSQSFDAACETIMARVREGNLSKIKDLSVHKQKVDKALAYYDAETGAFRDIDYDSKEKNVWDPVKHVDRLYDMAAAYTLPGTSFYGDKNLYSKIVKGFEYWCVKHPYCPNWWFNQVSVPRTIGLTLIVMRSGKEQIPENLEYRLLERLQRIGGNPTDSNRTGANKADIALHWMYRACLQKDKQTMDIAMHETGVAAEYTTGEGIQYDNSYFQHNEQLYIGGYSTVLLSRVAEIAWYTVGTPYALSEEQLQVLSSYISKTYLPCVRGNNVAFNVMGRSMSRSGQMHQGSAIGMLKKMAEIDKKRAYIYEDGVTTIYGKKAEEVIYPQTFTHYYIGDYSLFRNDAYTIGVRMVSDRTYRSEELRGENKKGYFVSDGSTAIMMTGNEYKDIFPIWDYNKIPGTTAVQNTLPSMDGIWTHKGESDFVGGVGDGKIGASAYKMHNKADGIDLSATKSWFFFGKEVVCLGANISTPMEEPVATTLNQCIYNGPVTVSHNGQCETIDPGTTKIITNPEWVLHDNICYFLTDVESITVSIEKRTGNWKDINPSQKDLSTSNTVFTASINHGTQPKDGKYCYIIVPEISSEKSAEHYNTEVLNIISNTNELQAVSHLGLKKTFAIFYEAGRFTSGNLEVSASQPCIVMVDEKAKMLRVSDPSHRQEALTVSIKAGNKAAKDYNFDLSQDDIHRGISHSIKL